MWEQIDGQEFHRTKKGELVPRYATPETLKMAREVNAANAQSVMGGSFRFNGWANGVFRFMTNQSSVIYADNGQGHYEIQLDLPAPSNKGNGF